jgi:hypothetical protein
MTDTRGLLILVLRLGLASSALAGEVRCTTTEDTLLNRLVTVCSDGTGAVSRDDTILQRWETTITESPRKACTAQMNPLTKQVEVRCR